METLVVAPGTAPTSARMASASLPRLLDLQILRALAASLVVLDHIFLSLNAVGIPDQQFLNPASLMGHFGVTAFFVLSGLIMVRQSTDLFGVPHSPVRFLYRRITRIVPMYWIATLVWLLIGGAGHPQHRLLQVFNSLFFIPNSLAADGRLDPLLQSGWTLNYEMGFYVLFALALFLPRRTGIVAILITLQGLIALGHSYTSPQSPATLLSFYTSPIVIYFAYGVLVGLLETEFRPIARITFPISPAFLLVLPAVAMLGFPGLFASAPLWDLLGFYAFIVVILCSIANQPSPGRLTQAFARLGDASYCTYLFHLLLVGAVALLVGGHLHSSHVSPALLIVIALATVVLANLFGLLIHHFIELRIINFFRSQTRVPVTRAAENPAPNHNSLNNSFAAQLELKQE